MSAITPLTNLPSIDDPDNFAAEADDFISNQLPQMVSELNTAFNGLTLISTTDTSASSVAIGLGAKSFTVSSGKSFVGGMFLMIADTAAPSTNWMYGQVTSYSGTSLVMNITAIGGSGTKTAWTISQSATGILGGGVVAGLGNNSFTGDQVLASGAAIEESVSTVASATTPDIWTSTSNNINYTGTAIATGFATAPQAGVRRKLLLVAAAQFTAGANMLIDGVASGQTFTGAARDEVEVIALSTTQFLLKITKYDGTTVSTASNSDYQMGTDTAKPLTSAVARARNLVMGTTVPSTAGTSIDFTGLPAWVKRITINLAGVSTNGTSSVLLQIGDSGGIENTGYASTTSTIGGTASNSTAGFLVGNSAAADVKSGILVLTLLDAATNTWAYSGLIKVSTANMNYSAGDKALSATLDRVRITTVAGVDTFDAGLINIIYE